MKGRMGKTRFMLHATTNTADPRGMITIQGTRQHSAKQRERRMTHMRVKLIGIAQY